MHFKRQTQNNNKKDAGMFAHLSDLILQLGLKDIQDKSKAVEALLVRDGAPTEAIEKYQEGVDAILKRVRARRTTSKEARQKAHLDVTDVEGSTF